MTAYDQSRGDVVTAAEFNTSSKHSFLSTQKGDSVKPKQYGKEVEKICFLGLFLGLMRK